MSEPKMTARNLRIAELRKKGLTSVQIGARLGITPGNVRNVLYQSRRAMAMDSMMIVTTNAPAITKT